MEQVIKKQPAKNLGVALIAVLLPTFLGCNTRPDFTGTYVNHASGEFSIADDTLQVEHLQAQEYVIHRKTGYREVAENGKPGKLQRHTEDWQAVYDPDTKVMTESGKGRRMTFEKGTMVLERSSYQRIN